VEWITRAIRQNPKPDYLSNLGTTLERQGRHEEALKVFDKTLQLSPRHWDAAYSSGSLLCRLGRFAASR